jgi:hypothetical protein
MHTTYLCNVSVKSTNDMYIYTYIEEMKYEIIIWYYGGGEMLYNRLEFQIPAHFV